MYIYIYIIYIYIYMCVCVCVCVCIVYIYEGIEATLNNQAKKPIATRALIKLLNLILTLNNFVFHGINYLQKKGCAIGTICAPVYANLFMGKLEKLHIYSYAKNFSTFYCRFIGDIFFLWNGTKSELIKFIEKHILTKNTLQ